MKKRFLTIIAAAALSISAVLGFGGCGRGGTIHIYVPDGPPLLAAARLFSERPEVEYEGGTRNVSYNLTTGQLIGSRLAGRFPDFALAPINLAVQNFNLNGDYIFGGVALWGMLHIVENTALSGDSPATSLGDLRGQVIYAYQPLMSPGIVLRTVLEGKELDVVERTVGGAVDPNAVNITYLTDNAAARAALMGEIAAVGNARFALVADPVVSALIGMPATSERNFEIAFDMQDEWENIFGFNFPQVAIMVRERFARRNPALTAAVLNMIAGSIDYTRNNAGEAARIATDEINSAYLPPRQVVTNFINGRGQEVFNFMSASDSRTAVTSFLQTLYNTSPAFIGGRMPVEGFFLS